jgi:CIC family chloride channel protein
MQRLRLYLSEGTPSKLILLGLIVGVGGAFGAIFFHLLIIVVSSAFYGNHGTDFIDHVSQMPEWQRVLIPTIGGFLVGLFFWITKVSEAKGEGVPEVLNALNFKEGNILFAVAPVKVITSALTLGTGGSAGREGPVIQIGSAIGSSIARFFYLKGDNQSLLLSAGAAAAIGGTFGAPLAGVVFTLEILKHRPSIFRLSVIVVAAFVGQYVTNLLTSGNGLDFFVPDLQLSNWVLVSGLTVVFGILAAFTAVTFGTILTFSHFIFSKISSSHILRATLGGFLIGLISLYLPYIHEQAAYPLMVDIVALTSLPITFLAILLLSK